MAQQWLGYTVSIDCGKLGVFQGKVSSVDAVNQSLTLNKVFQNGVPHSSPSVIISAQDIKKLDIIEEPQAPLDPVVELKKPIPKRPGRIANYGEQNFHSQPAPPRSLHFSNEAACYANEVIRTPNKRERLRQRWQERDEACFGSPIDDNDFDQDFDFEKNLALFDKQAVYDEIAVQRPDLVRQADGQKKIQNYRHNENVITSNRMPYPTIVVPNPGDIEYVTDDGLVIPSMRPDLLRQLHQKAEDYGFSLERQLEILGRCASEMSLQLLGGAHRLNRNNAHQWPTVVVMCGPNSQGTVGVICARQLESQGVTSIVYVLDTSTVPPMMSHELALYKMGSSKMKNSTHHLPVAADLIVMALAGHSQSDFNTLAYTHAIQWVNKKRAPILALDPPPSGTPGVIAKFSLVPSLPLSYSPQNGKIYLCNLGIPHAIYSEMGITYRSPFGSKFVIPLHPNDDI